MLNENPLFGNLLSEGNEVSAAAGVAETGEHIGRTGKRPKITIAVDTKQRVGHATDRHNATAVDMGKSTGQIDDQNLSGSTIRRENDAAIDVSAWIADLSKPRRVNSQLTDGNIGSVENNSEKILVIVIQLEARIDRRCVVGFGICHIPRVENFVLAIDSFADFFLNQEFQIRKSVARKCTTWTCARNG